MTLSSPPPQPIALEVWQRHIPQALRGGAGWLLWRYEIKNGKWTKPPVNVDGVKINVGDPDNWVDFTTVLQSYQKEGSGFDGIGISLNSMPELAGVALDHCVEGEKIEPWALEIIEELGGYAEISPSGTGIRVLGYGKLRRVGRKKGNIEMYDADRYLTVTGHKLDNLASDLLEFDEALNRVHARIWPDSPEDPLPTNREDEIGEDLVERFQALCDDDPIFNEKFNNSASVGDRSDREFHLCARLWETGFNEAEIKRLMDFSPQTKWGKRDDAYKDRTIKKAISSARLSERGRAEAVEKARATIEAAKEGLIANSRGLRERTVLGSLLTLRELDPLEFDLVANDLRQARVVKIPTLNKMVNNEKRLQNVEKLKEMGAGNGGSDDPENAATKMVRLADSKGATYWKSTDGDPYITIINEGTHSENHPLKSAKVKTWLIGLVYDEIGLVPKGFDAADAISILAGRALFEGETYRVYTRVAEYDGKFYLDLGSDDWSAVEVGSDGWKVIPSDEVPVKFRRSKGILHLPEPEKGGDLESLRKVLNVPDGDQWILVQAWLVQAIKPTGPYPVLIVDGEQGSGKSWLGRILREMIDPNTAPLRRPPRNEHDMMIAATNSWVVIYDNLSGLPPWLGDTLCVVSTGGGMSTRELYTDADEALFDIQRPVVLNGITTLTTRGDLLGRAILLHLPRIEDGERKTEKEIKAELDRIRPGVLGALLDVVSHGIRELQNVRLDTMPRMADFVEWVVACEGALGWESGAFLKAFDSNQKESKVALIENDLFAMALINFLDSTPDPETGIKDNIKGLLTTLETRSKVYPGSKIDGWPRTPKGCGNKLRRLVPALRAMGIDIEFTRDEKNSSVVELRRVPSTTVSTTSDMEAEKSIGTDIPDVDENGKCEKSIGSDFPDVSDVGPTLRREGEYVIEREKEDIVYNKKSSDSTSRTSGKSDAIEKSHLQSRTLKTMSEHSDYVPIAEVLAEGDRRQAEKDEKFKTPDGGRLFDKSIAFWRDLARQHNGLTIQVLRDELSYDADKANIALNDLKRRGWAKDDKGRLHPPGERDPL